MVDNPMTRQPVVLELPGMDAVSIERNVPYGSGGPRRPPCPRAYRHAQHWLRN